MQLHGTTTARLADALHACCVLMQVCDAIGTMTSDYGDEKNELAHGQRNIGAIHGQRRKEQERSALRQVVACADER